ncbi:MAG: hypothetical protein Q7R92_00155 [bacterium]|nr:hypothetical protein [bacterium]
MIPDLFLKLNLKNKIIASLAGFAVLIFLLIYLVVAPTMRDILAMGKNIEEQRIDLERKYQKGQSLKQLSENLKAIKPKLILLDQAFISKNRDLEFITSLENQANLAQVGQKINLGSPQDAEDKKLQKNNLQLFTKGTFAGQLNYLLNLETLSYYINVKLLELTPAEGGQAGINGQENQTSPKASDSINMFISADTYWKKE